LLSCWTLAWLQTGPPPSIIPKRNKGITVTSWPPRPSAIFPSRVPFFDMSPQGTPRGRGWTRQKICHNPLCPGKPGAQIWRIGRSTGLQFPKRLANDLECTVVDPGAGPGLAGPAMHSSFGFPFHRGSLLCHGRIRNLGMLVYGFLPISIKREGTSCESVEWS